MRLLVTGSEGSLAQAVIPRLLSAGHQVVGCDSLARHGRPAAGRGGYELTVGDLSEPADVRRLCAGGGFDAVFHFAALVYGVVGFHRRPADILIDNGLMVMNLLKHAGPLCGRFIYLSSSMVYERCARLPHAEPDADASAVMSTSYGLSKYLGERLVKACHEQYGLPFVIWRPFNIITPFEPPEEEGFSHVFTDLIRKIVVERQRPLRILGDGTQVRCFTHIDDVAEAVARFSLDERACNETFNVGNPEPVSVAELARRIVDIAVALGALPSDYVLAFAPAPAYPDDVRRRIPDIAKLERTFGWRPGVRLDASLRACIRSLVAGR